MPKSKRNWRGKRGGNHSTAIEAAWRFLPDVIKDDSVNRISLGFITGGKGGGNSTTSVKIIDDVNCILLSVRGGSAHQEIRVFAHDTAAAKKAIEEAAAKANFRVSHGNKAEE